MNYDGPSFYKKDHKKIKSDKQEKNGFSRSERHQLPKKQTRQEVMNEAKEYMTTPPNYLKEKTEDFPVETNKKDIHFKRKYIPKSLQKLDGWKRREWKQDLLLKLEERLSKESDDYLLFTNDSQINENEDKQQNNLANNQLGKQKAKKNNNAQKKIASAHREFKKDLTKPTTGLHRSLSNIISEDEAALKSGKNNLESLFTHSKR